LQEYGITRKSVARLMRCDPGTVDRDLRLEGGGRAAHGDEPIELPL
jgi:hypothetical protein